MSTTNPQVIDRDEFIDSIDYSFSGDNYTVERKRAFVQEYRERGSIYHAAIAAKVSRKTVYNWLERDEQFATAVTDAKEDGIDNLESSVYERAFKDSILAMFYLKAHRPKFRDRMTVDLEQVDAELAVHFSKHRLPSQTVNFIDADDSSLPAISPPVRDEQKDED